MGAVEPVHWVILLIIAGLLFGGYKKLPEMARSAGRSMRVFKTELKGLEDDDEARASAAQNPGYVQPVPPAQPGVHGPTVAAGQPAPAQYAPTAQPAAPAQYTAPAQPAPAPYAAPAELAAPAPASIPAPAAVVSAPAVEQPAVTAQSAYVATEPATDPTAPPRG